MSSLKGKEMNPKPVHQVVHQGKLAPRHHRVLAVHLSREMNVQFVSHHTLLHWKSYPAGICFIGIVLEPGSNTNGSAQYAH